MAAHTTLRFDDSQFFLSVAEKQYESKRSFEHTDLLHTQIQQRPILPPMHATKLLAANNYSLLKGASGGGCQRKEGVRAWGWLWEPRD